MSRHATGLSREAHYLAGILAVMEDSNRQDICTNAVLAFAMRKLGTEEYWKRYKEAPSVSAPEAMRSDEVEDSPTATARP